MLTSMSLSEKAIFSIDPAPGAADLAGGAFTIDGVLNRFNGNLSSGNSLSFSAGIPVTEGQIVRVLKPTYDRFNPCIVVNLHGYLEDA